MWLTGWSDLYAIVVVGLACYLTVVVLLRATGKRTLTKLNAFDFVVTVSIGSLLATGVLDPTTSWAAVATGILVLVVAQWVMARMTSTWPRSRWFVTAEPTLVLRDGKLLQDALRSSRVAPSEVLQAVRTSGSGSLASVAAVTLEPDGSLSVISKDNVGDGSALADVPGLADETADVPGLPRPDDDGHV